jgi:hypothetical protein
LPALFNLIFFTALRHKQVQSLQMASSFFRKRVALDNLNSGGCIFSPRSQINSWKMPNIN